MKTAIIKTSFWKEDRIFELTPDVRHFYLCLLTNPERNTTQAFKCSDRLMSVYTGYNIDTLNLCRKALIEKELIIFIDGYYILNNQDYVEPKKGKLTATLQEKYLSELPDNIKVLLLNHSSATLEGSLEYIDIDKDIDNNKDKKAGKTADKKPAKFTQEGAEVLKLFEGIDSQNKMFYANKTQRAACDFLIAEYGFPVVRKVIEEILPVTNTRPRYEFPHITTPDQLVKSWVKVKNGIVTKKEEVAKHKDVVAF